MIRENLANKRIAITGSTGFVGTALVERLLRAVPECRLVLLVRPSKRHHATERVRREIFKNDAFDRLRAELKDTDEPFEAMVARRVVAVGGDVTTDGLGLNEDDRATFLSCDTIIHSAAAVAFDSPLDTAVEINLLGPTRVAQAIAATQAGRAGGAAHLVAVSTAYVAGTRRGDAPEALLTETPFATAVEWKGEVAAARRARANIDAESRSPKHATRFHKQARAELGAAGTPLLADKSEKLRTEWVREQLGELGRSRAAMLGWPDAYAYTKALGERALLETHGDVPITTVRPSIIESAVSEPR